MMTVGISYLKLLYSVKLMLLLELPQSLRLEPLQLLELELPLP